MAIQFGNIDRELADRQNVIKEDAARQYRGSRDMMQSVTDLGDTISREVKEYKANQRADQRLDYKFKRDEENAKVRDEQHNMNIMKTKLSANKEMRERSLQSYTLKKWPYGKMATHERYESELQAWRDSDQSLAPLDKIYTFGSLYSEAALRAVRVHQTIMNSEKGFKDEETEAASLRKISRFQPVKIMEWAENNKLYDPKDYGDPTAQADADATNIINTHMPGLVTDANDFVNRTKSGLTFTRYTGEDNKAVQRGEEIRRVGFSTLGEGSQDESKSIFNELLDGIEVGRQTETEVPETITEDGSETTDRGVQFKGDKKPHFLNYLSVRGRQKIKDYETRDMTNKLILDRDPHETTNSEIYHNLRVLEGYSGGEMVDDNKKLIAAGSVDANGLVNKSPEQRDVLISMLEITDPAKKKEWENYLMSDNVNKAYGYVKPGSATGPRQDTRTSEQEQKRSLLKLNPDQVSKLQRWAYNKSLGEMDRNHPHLSGGKAYKEIPYLKHILGDMGFRHGSSFMVKKEGDTGRYPKFGNAVKELTEADAKDEQLAAWEKMDKELFSTGIYSKGREGKSGEESQRFIFLRDRMDRLKNWITEGQYKGGGLFRFQYLQKK